MINIYNIYNFNMLSLSDLHKLNYLQNVILKKKIENWSKTNLNKYIFSDKSTAIKRERTS